MANKQLNRTTLNPGNIKLCDSLHTSNEELRGLWRELILLTLWYIVVDELYCLLQGEVGEFSHDAPLMLEVGHALHAHTSHNDHH